MDEHLKFLSEEDYPFWRSQNDVENLTVREFPQYEPPKSIFHPERLFGSDDFNDNAHVSKEPVKEYKEDGATRFLDMSIYRKKFGYTWIPKDSVEIKVSKTSGKVKMSPNLLVKKLMDPEKLMELFPSLVDSAVMMEDGSSTTTNSKRVSSSIHGHKCSFDRTLYEMPHDTFLIVDTPVGASTPQLPFLRSVLVQAPTDDGEDFSQVVWIEFHHVGLSSSDWYDPLPL